MRWNNISRALGLDNDSAIVHTNQLATQKTDAQKTKYKWKNREIQRESIHIGEIEIRLIDLRKFSTHYRAKSRLQFFFDLI
jgi:hypothetical protein